MGEGKRPRCSDEFVNHRVRQRADFLDVDRHAITGLQPHRRIPREADTVIQYLITHFGPGQPLPAGKPITLPGGAGKELVETRCAVCHDLERVTIVKRQPRDWETIVGNMYERWGMSAPDEVRTITSYLVAQFGRD